MAEYLIQDTTLDAIADAINAKTGGSSAMTPAQMVTAIGTISGGALGEFELINTITISEPVSQININFPSGYQQIGLSIDISSDVNSKKILYHNANVAPSRSLVESATTIPWNYSGYIATLDPITLDGRVTTARTALSGSNGGGSVAYPFPTSLAIVCTASGSTIVSGTIKVYGR